MLVSHFMIVLNFQSFDPSWSYPLRYLHFHDISTTISRKDYNKKTLWSCQYSYIPKRELIQSIFNTKWNLIFLHLLHSFEVQTSKGLEDLEKVSIYRINFKAPKISSNYRRPIFLSYSLENFKLIFCSQIVLQQRTPEIILSLKKHREDLVSLSPSRYSLRDL